MDTPTIAQYYRETDPAKRKELLEQAIAEEGATEENQARKEIWDARYSMKSDLGVQPYFRKQMVQFQRRPQGSDERTQSGPFCGTCWQE